MALHCPHCDAALAEADHDVVVGGDAAHLLCLSCGAPVSPDEAVFVPGAADGAPSSPLLELVDVDSLGANSGESFEPGGPLELDHGAGGTLDLSAVPGAPIAVDPQPIPAPRPPASSRQLSAPLPKAHEAPHPGAEKPPMPVTFSDTLTTVLRYPITNPFAFVVLSVVTGVFAAFRGFSGWAWLLSEGVLIWYSLDALSRVTNGDLRYAAPDFTEKDDIIRPARLSFAAMLASSAPLLVVSVMIGVAISDPRDLMRQSREREAAAVSVPKVNRMDARKRAELELQRRGATRADLELDEPGRAPPPEPVLEVPDAAPPEAAPIGAGLVAAALLAFAWKVLVLPASLLVAGITRSFWTTLIPLAAVAIIPKMGSTFFRAAGVFTCLALVQAIVVAILDRIPTATYTVKPFVDAYVALASGCVLGIAAHEKIDELGFS